jgi:hypothetical protein
MKIDMPTPLCGNLSSKLKKIPMTEDALSSLCALIIVAIWEKYQSQRAKHETKGTLSTRITSLLEG